MGQIIIGAAEHEIDLARAERRNGALGRGSNKVDLVMFVGSVDDPLDMKQGHRARRRSS